MSELKPCPFCGSDNVKSEEPLDVIYCLDCGAEMATDLGDWNTRPIEDELHARIAELEVENERLQDAWFVDETICPDGSLRPKVSTLLKRIAELEAERRWIPVSERLPEVK